MYILDHWMRLKIILNVQQLDKTYIVVSSFTIDVEMWLFAGDESDESLPF